MKRNIITIIVTVIIVITIGSFGLFLFNLQSKSTDQKSINTKGNKILLNSGKNFDGKPKLGKKEGVKDDSQITKQTLRTEDTRLEDSELKQVSKKTALESYVNFKYDSKTVEYQEYQNFCEYTLDTCISDDTILNGASVTNGIFSEKDILALSANKDAKVTCAQLEIKTKNILHCNYKPNPGTLINGNEEVKGLSASYYKLDGKIVQFKTSSSLSSSSAQPPYGVFAHYVISKGVFAHYVISKDANEQYKYEQNQGSKKY